MAENSKVAQKWVFAHQLSSLLFTRILIMGPVERIKIIMQTKHLAKFANPRSDMPKNIPDLVGSK